MNGGDRSFGADAKGAIALLGRYEGASVLWSRCEGTSVLIFSTPSEDGQIDNSVTRLTETVDSGGKTKDTKDTNGSISLLQYARFIVVVESIARHNNKSEMLPIPTEGEIAPSTIDTTRPPDCLTDLFCVDWVEATKPNTSEYFVGFRYR